jgi:gluconokinase
VKKLKTIVLMGVSGSGKTTVGKLLAENLNYSFFDADDFHPITNKCKMREGTPLSDEDRFPWIATLNELLLKNRGEGLVLACSALKGNYELIDQRLSQRSNHFMPQGLLRSQFQDLEVPDYAQIVDVAQPLDSIVEKIIKGL